MTARVAILAALVVTLAAPVTAQAPAMGEYEVKAAFLFNFAKFVEWPENDFPDAKGPLVIGVLGTDPFGAALDQIIAEKRVNGRPFVIRRLADANNLQGCHILFISPSERASAKRLLAALARRSVLTVGETDGFADAGGVIEFFVQDNRVRF